ncbi:Nudix hydrolase 3 [Acorus calamus]|uniref:Nudix hydrolase 3 n=1 Tax=Acorus calamus TaxID=4465 RepID=A0AAV9FAY8_ACOCL|nr:Nudix hydrolase 3 [Acorus calamus]
MQFVGEYGYLELSASSKRTECMLKTLRVVITALLKIWVTVVLGEDSSSMLMGRKWFGESHVHRDGDYHRAVHVWIFSESTQELLLQRRADCKDSWPGLWDISSAGHISAGDSSLLTARRELEEELGITLPKDAFELIFVFLQECVINDGLYINNEFNDVYLVTTLEPIPLEGFTLQETEVSDVKYVHWTEYKNCLAKEDKDYVPYDVSGQYGQLFSIIEKRYNVNNEARSRSLKKQLARYAPVFVDAELSLLSEGDRQALDLIIKAARIMDDIYYTQVWDSNPVLRDWLKANSNISDLDSLKWMYYSINKSPWSVLDENEAFLTTSDSAIKMLNESTKPVSGWKGLRYRAAFPVTKPPGANFYPPDMDKMEFELWTRNLNMDERKTATGYFNVIRRHSDSAMSSTEDHITSAVTDKVSESSNDLYVVPFSREYRHFLVEAAKLLREAAEVADSLRCWLTEALICHQESRSTVYHSLKTDSTLDVTIGPYETYEDALFGYKATFEAYIGIRDVTATSQVKLFGDYLQNLEQNLPIDDVYKSKEIVSAPIRVIRLIFNAGDVKGPQTVAFNLPNDERIVSERGTAMVMLKNISEAKFKHILQPIANELQELHSALEEAKADIVGLWALKFLINQVEGAVESLSREILTIQAKGDKAAAKSLLDEYAKMTEPLADALGKLERVEMNPCKLVSGME